MIQSATSLESKQAFKCSGCGGSFTGGRVFLEFGKIEGECPEFGRYICKGCSGIALRRIMIARDECEESKPKR